VYDDVGIRVRGRTYDIPIDRDTRPQVFRRFRFGFSLAHAPMVEYADIDIIIIITLCSETSARAGPGCTGFIRSR